MLVSGETTEVEANMLKGIMSQLQLNTLAGNLVKNRQNNLPKPDSVSAQYSVMEVSTTRLKTDHSICQHTAKTCRTGKLYYSAFNWLYALRSLSGIEFRRGRDFPPLQTGPGAHPASCKMDTGSFPGVKCGRGLLLTTQPLLVPRSWKSRAIPLPTL